jgi:hypothetical protein
MAEYRIDPFWEIDEMGGSKKLMQTMATMGLMVAWMTAAAEARVWTDSSGRYTLEAKLVTFNDKSVVLQREDHELVAIPIDKLSEQDRAFLKSKEAGETSQAAWGGMQTWTLRDGTKLVGRIVDYATRDITLQRRRGRIYVNDRVYENLPEFYQLLIPKIVAQIENLRASDRPSLESWLARQPGATRTLHLEGVVLETENGDEYGVPFAMFSDKDLKLLKPGWEKWLAAHGDKNYDDLDHRAFMLRSLAAARAHDARVEREIAMMQLQAVAAGLTSLWEVTLYPAAGHGGPPLWVVEPGRTSRDATEAALARNPGYVAGPVRRVAG